MFYCPRLNVVQSSCKVHREIQWKSSHCDSGVYIMQNTMVLDGANEIADAKKMKKIIGGKKLKRGQETGRKF